MPEPIDPIVDDEEEIEQPTGLLLDNDTLANAPFEGDIKIPLRRETAEEEDEAPVDEEEIEEDTEEEDTSPPPTAPTPLTDPGAFVPNDYSFEVTTYDADGNNPKIVKISSTEQWDKLLEDEPSFGSTAAFMKASRAISRMENNQEHDKAAYDTKVADYAAQQTAAAHNETVLSNWEKEIGYLVAQKKLPTITPEQSTLNWADPDVAKQPGIREQLALMKYMNTESKRRIAAGLPPVTSMIEAYNAKRLDDMTAETTESTQRQATARKQRGAMVNRAQSAPIKEAPKGMIVGTGGSLDDLETFGL